MSAWIRPEFGATVTAGQGQITLNGQWMSNVVRAGFPLIAPSPDGQIYEVTEVSTSGGSTLLTLDRPYGGATGTSVPIAILPLYSNDAEAASSFATTLSAWATRLGDIYRVAGNSREIVLRRAFGTSTAAILFGTDTEDRFRIGFIGDEVFRLQRSTDGETWIDAIAVNPTTGDVNFAGLAALLAAKAPLDSPPFTGSPTVPTAAADAANTQAANTVWVRGRVAELASKLDTDMATLDAAIGGKQTATAATSALAAVTPSTTRSIPRFTSPTAADLVPISNFWAGRLADADDAAARAGLGVQAVSPLLTALAGLTTSSDRLIYATGSNAFGTTVLSAFARSLLDDADADAGRATLDAQQHGAALDALRTLTPAPGKLPAFAGGATAELWDGGATGKAVLASATQAAARAAIGAVGKASARNRHLNPAFQICQDRALGSTITLSAGGYAMDGVYVWAAGGGALTCSQVAKSTPSGSPYRFRATVSTADNSLAASDAYSISFPIEGVDVADLRMGTVLSSAFYWRAVVNFPAGTYGLLLRNGALTRSYLTAFTISPAQAGTDVLVSAAIPGDIAGTWISDVSGIGIRVEIQLATGAGQVGVAGAWQTAASASTAAQTNGMASTSNVFEVCDIGLYPGAELPAWEMPSYPDDMTRCRRYFQALGGEKAAQRFGAGVYINSTTVIVTESLAVKMRVPPSISFSSPSDFLVEGNGGATVSAIATAGDASTDALSLSLTVASGAAGQGVLLRAFNTLSARIFLNARL